MSYKRQTYSFHTINMYYSTIANRINYVLLVMATAALLVDSFDESGVIDLGVIALALAGVAVGVGTNTRDPLRPADSFFDPDAMAVIPLAK